LFNGGKMTNPPKQASITEEYSYPEKRKGCGKTELMNTDTLAVGEHFVKDIVRGGR
jgi:hypothetical protein